MRLDPWRPEHLPVGRDGDRGELPTELLEVVQEIFPRGGEQ